jgi:hypothetical protein
MLLSAVAVQQNLFRQAEEVSMKRTGDPVKSRVRSAFASLIVASLLSACGSRPAAESESASGGWSSDRLDSLRRFYREDQAGRADIKASDSIQYAMHRADSARTEWLRAALARDGWPARALYGDSASDGAFLIVQHSADTAWQRQILPVLDSLGRAAQIARSDVALLTDRVRQRQGRLQVYGTQFSMVDGRLVLDPIEDSANVEARRKDVGLPSLAKQAEVISEVYKMPVGSSRPR